MKFDAIAGTTYRIETLNLQPGTDPYLELYADWVISDDDSNGGNADLLVWTPTRTGTYALAVRQVGGGGSTASGYDLRITALPNVEPQVWVPLIRR